MDFDLSNEQRMLQDSVGRLMAEQCDFEQRRAHMAQERGYSLALWSMYADLGLLGLPFAEADGGFDGGPVDTMIVMQHLGRSLALDPYLATVVLAGGLLRDTGSTAQRAAYLPRLAAGTLIMAFAHSETQARYDLVQVECTARLESDDWVINGKKRFVMAGDCAELLIISARTQGHASDATGISLFLVDAQAAGVTRRSYRTQDHVHAADIQLSNVRVKKNAMLGLPGAALPEIERSVDTAIAALCAEAIGVMERTLELTVEYLKMRKQFGVAIGSFQALQHRAVDMLVAIEQARSMAMYATMMSTEADSTKRSHAMSAAKVQIGKSARFVGQEALQLHGGIGMTEECQVGHYFRRLTVIEMLFGDVSHHLQRLGSFGGSL